MRKYLIKMRCQPVWCVIKANDEDEALDKAVDQDEWTEYTDYGGETFDVEDITDKEE